LGYELHICDLWIVFARGVIGIALDKERERYRVESIRDAGVCGICGGYGFVVDSGAVGVV